MKERGPAYFLITFPITRAVFSTISLRAVAILAGMKKSNFVYESFRILATARACLHYIQT